jgi:hypothetical protein
VLGPGIDIGGKEIRKAFLLNAFHSRSHAVAACNFHNSEPRHPTVRFNLLRRKKPFRKIDYALRFIQIEFFQAGIIG